MTGELYQDALLLGLVVSVAGLLALSRYVLEDARRRGHTPVLVLALVLGCFPVGLILWLVTRPPMRRSAVAAWSLQGGRFSRVD